METSTRITPESAPGGKKEKNQNIQVFVRVRPMNSQENLKNAAQVIDTPGSREVVVRERSVACVTKTFTFDRVFGPRSKQIDVYKTVVSPLLSEVLLGYNCTVFAYGQTGTGKTFTMEGERSQKQGTTVEIDPQAGILPRALSQLFDEVRLMNCEFTVRVSFLELYNEELFDLLAPIEESKTKTLRLFEDTHRKGSVIIQGLEEVIVNNKQEVYAVLDRGSQQRKTAATLMNATSSRSHTIFTITVHLKESSVEGEEMLKVGKLHLVDLAGSENIGKSGAVDKRAREAGSINQSLLTLGRVISALVERTPHIPYRESKLTRLLQDSLGGKTKTSIIATVSPAMTNIEETLSTLDYAHRAKNIMNKPEVNQKLTKKEALNIYTDEIERLRRDLYAARDKNGIFMDNDNYNRIMYQIQAQHAELNEKSNKIRELEEAIAEKEEAERESALAMEEMQVDLQIKQSMLEDARTVQKNLQKKLQTEEKRADELKYLVKYHLEAEEKITGEASTLLNTATDSVAVIESLHNRLDRKQGIEERNWINAQRFRDEFRRNMEEILGTVNVLREGHTLSISDIREKFDTRSTERRILLEAFAKVLNNASSAVETINVELLGVVGKQVNVVEMRTNAMGELIGSKCDSSRDALANKMKVIAECVESLRGLFESLHSENLKLEKSIEKEYATLSNEVKNTLSANSTTFARLDTVLMEMKKKWDNIYTDGMTNFNTFKAGQDKYKEDCNRKFDEMQKELDYFTQKAAGMQETLKKLKTETSDHVGNSEETFKLLVTDVDNARQMVEPVVNDSSKCIQDAKVLATSLHAQLNSFEEKNVDHHKKALEGINEKLKKAKSSTFNKIQETAKAVLSDQNCTLDQVTKAVNTGQAKLLGDMKELNTEIISGVQKQGAEIGSMKENCYSAVKSLSDGENKHSKEMLTTVNEQCDRVTNSATKVNNMLQHTQGNVDEFWEETYMVDSPSGGTPMRRKYDFPSKLTVPSPHERIMARYRAVSKKVQYALDDCSRGPEDLDCSWSDNYFRNLNVPVVNMDLEMGQSDGTESEGKEDMENENPALTEESTEKMLETIQESIEPKENNREPERCYSSSVSSDDNMSTPRETPNQKGPPPTTGKKSKFKGKIHGNNKKGILRPPN